MAEDKNTFEEDVESAEFIILVYHGNLTDCFLAEITCVQQRVIIPCDIHPFGDILIEPLADSIAFIHDE